MFRNAVRTTLAVALAAAAFNASAAGSQTASVGVSTTVITNCSVTATAISFGNYDVLAATATTATGSLALVCSQGTTPKVYLGHGGFYNAGMRRMNDGGTNHLPYSIYKPTSNAAGAACTGATTPYDEVAPGNSLPAAPSVASRTFNLCGSIAAGIDVPVGTYSDTVLATVDF
jgi:spore coat protein U-like protein